MLDKGHHHIRIETEVKFSATDNALFAGLSASPHLGNFQLDSLGIKKHVDRYLDTSDRRLFQTGYACRVRRVGAQQILTLKSLTPPDGSIHRRQEFEAEVESDQPITWAKSQAQSLLTTIIGDAPLQTLFTLHQTRHKYLARLGDTPIIEVSLDEVSLNKAYPIDYFEVEAELLDSGDEHQLAEFVKILQAHWNLQPETKSKFERALELVDKTDLIKGHKP